MKFEEDTAFKISNNNDESITESISEEDQPTKIERENDSEPSSMSNYRDSENINNNNKKRPL